ncbi:putative nuclear RNA export factor SDE5 [Impatiens glandulifera]|uniref:putative nuclear RNA export factor SDE5 n=1 Tax=Impatiens glandulifera TaxID=253017 RepID=UPI001FB059CF|nr:putative nuclear RNA export factor SDE5 [Impatiens glandulifera]
MEGNSETDSLERDLEHLLGAFGSSASLEEIASAYSKAQHDVLTAAEMLCNNEGSTSRNSTSVAQNGNEVLLKSVKEIDYYVEPKKKQKKKKITISTGTVSSMITRDYSHCRQPRKASPSEVTKPLKLICYEPSASDILDEKPVFGNSAKNGSLHKNDEVILLQRLGDDSQYVGPSGHNLHKSMEQQFPEKLQNVDPTNGDKRRLMIESEKEKERQKLSKEALLALFSLSKRFEQPPKLTLPRRQEGISRGSGYVVSGPFEDVKLPFNKTVTAKQVIKNEEEDEDSYQILRQAVQEHLITMKAFYKSAAEALAAGDNLRADKMMEEGNFFKKKAQEADERSALKFLEDGENEDGEFHIDLTELELKESIQYLKTQLAFLPSIPTFQYLKVMFGSGTEDPKGNKKKRVVVKLLERGSIKWAEENDGKVISILLEDVPKNLSFAKKEIEG